MDTIKPWSWDLLSEESSQQTVRGGGEIRNEGDGGGIQWNSAWAEDVNKTWMKVKLHGAAVLELHPSIECDVCQSVPHEVSVRPAAGALWMRGYFKTQVMQRFNFWVKRDDTWLLPNPFMRFARRLMGADVQVQHVPAQTWSLFEVRSQRGRRETRAHSPDRCSMNHANISYIMHSWSSCKSY